MWTPDCCHTFMFNTRQGPGKLYIYKTRFRPYTWKELDLLFFFKHCSRFGNLQVFSALPQDFPSGCVTKIHPIPAFTVHTPHTHTRTLPVANTVMTWSVCLAVSVHTQVLGNSHFKATKYLGLDVFTFSSHTRLPRCKTSRRGQNWGVAK